MRVAALALAASIALFGCATAGNQKMAEQSKESIASQITEGRSTKKEVASMLGDATTVSFTDSGNEIWTYKHDRATPKAINFIPIANLFMRGADIKTRELVVMFDKSGVVSKYSMRETQSEVKAGITQ